MPFEASERDGGVVLVAAGLRALGVPHAFGTRHGGVSKGRYASLNVGLFGEDPTERVRENWSRLTRRAGLDPRGLRVVRQVHGVEVLEAAAPPPGTPLEPAGAADGLETSAPGVALGITTADCVPVLLAWAARPGAPARVAALHCGWRGVRDGLLSRYLAARRSPPDAVALGPHIRECHFEVGPEVAEELDVAGRALGAPPGAVLAPGRGERSHARLERLLELQLRAAGVPEGRVERGAPCTYCDPERFFSYRRDGAGGGLLGHVIGVPGHLPRP